MPRDQSLPTRNGADTSGTADGGSHDGMDPAAYLDRIGVDPVSVGEPDLSTLARLQGAHVRSVPFENLAIVGDPYGDREGSGVVLELPALYEKIVERRLGGYCFELNGLFHWLLDELGYDVDRVAARVTADEGTNPPANHHVNVVALDRRYVVDVGTGAPMCRRPLPLDGTPRTDEAGVEWRVVDSDRPDEEYATEYRAPGEDAWSERYVFSDVPRTLGYFAATCDYLQSAPESTFTGDPIVALTTADGHLKLSRDTFTETAGTESERRTVTGSDWHRTLVDEFGLDYGDG